MILITNISCQSNELRCNIHCAKNLPKIIVKFPTEFVHFWTFVSSNWWFSITNTMNFMKTLGNCSENCCNKPKVVNYKQLWCVMFAHIQQIKSIPCFELRNVFMAIERNVDHLIVDVCRFWTDDQFQQHIHEIISYVHTWTHTHILHSSSQTNRKCYRHSVITHTMRMGNLCKTIGKPLCCFKVKL